MTYEQLKNRIPEGIPKKIRKQKEVGPKSVLIFFAVTMLLFIIFGTIVQYAFGMVGVAITEIFFLIISVLYVKRKHLRIREVFPVHKPKLTAICGTVILWFATFEALNAIESILLILFPEIPESSDAEVILADGLPWFALFVIVALLPPICEEAMHRGVIQYGMKKKIRNPYVMALVIGLLFGIYHLDVSKFLVTGVLGGVMGYILCKTDNMVYSSFFHFVHNGSQLLLLALLPGIVTIDSLGIHPNNAASKVFFLETLFGSYLNETGAMMISAGVLVIFSGLFLPILFYTGNYLLLRDTAPRRRTFFPVEEKKKKAMKKRLLSWTIGIMAFGAVFGLLGLILLF